MLPPFRTPQLRAFGTRLPFQRRERRGSEGSEKSRRRAEENRRLALVALKLINTPKLCPVPSGTGVPEVSPTPHSRRKKENLLLPGLAFPPRPYPGLVPGQERALGEPEWYRVRVPKRIGCWERKG